MIGETYVAVQAMRYPAASFAFHYGSKSSAVSEQYHLLAGFECDLYSIGQRWGEEGILHYLFPAQVFDVDNAHFGLEEPFAVTHCELYQSVLISQGIKE